MLFKGNKQRTQDGKRALDEALGAWREAEAVVPAERLSSGARANVRALARRGAAAAPERPLVGLFVPVGRLVAAAGVPALLLAVSFGWFIGGDGAELGRSETPGVGIETSKVKGQAVFNIANGGRVHHVYKANSAKELARAELYTTTRGSFKDSLDGDPGVIFYRID